MSLDVHAHAELLMGQADRYAVQGRQQEAAATYRAAAAEEVRAFHLIPNERIRTKGVIAVSAVALYRKAQAFDEAIRAAHAFLSLNELAEPVREDLEELLDEIRAEHSAQSVGRALAKDSFEWVLRGPMVGLGDARLATVVQKIEQVAKYGVRVYEYLAKAPIRLSGRVDPRVAQAFEMRVTQPSAGSFRFLVRFSMPTRNLPLFDAAEPVQPEQVAAAFSQILEAGADPDPESSALDLVVPDPQYQDAFLRLVRTLAPDGKDLSRVEINGRGIVATSTVLTPPLARAISAQLAKRHPPEAREGERVDILRGLNLNEGWILLGKKGQEQKCYVAEGVVLTDVIEGLIDRPVRVTGHRERNKFVIDDLEAAALDTDTEESQNDHESPGG